MNINNNIDPKLEKDLVSIINKVQKFANVNDSIVLKLLKQKNLPELYKKLNN